MSDQLNLAPPLREALIGYAPIVALINTFEGEPAVFTRRPLPAEVQFPALAISPDVGIADMDGLTARRPLVMRDITAYGDQGRDYRDVEQLGYLIRGLFHRNPFAIAVPGYKVVSIIASGPYVGATSDDASMVARMVGLTVQLAALA
jgi:hypothetical protein